MANSADPVLQRPTDLDLHCLHRQGISGFSRTRVNRRIQKHESSNRKKKRKQKWAAVEDDHNTSIRTSEQEI